MCLTLKTPKQYTAKTDIRCYKWVESPTLNIYITPYMGDIVKIGSTYTSEFSFSSGGREVDKGLHSFSAKKTIEELMTHYGFKGFIVRCTIPKGSRYYRGNYGTYLNGLVSDCIVYNKIIKEI